MKTMHMDGRLMLTSRQIDEDTFRTLIAQIEPSGFKNKYPELEDPMMIEMVNRCHIRGPSGKECGGSMTVGDYVCWGFCYSCYEDTISE